MIKGHSFLRRFVTIGVGVFLLFSLAGCGHGDNSRVHIAVASSLTNVMDELETRLESEGYPDATVSPAGSQTVARQVAGGQRADVVALASRRWMDYLEEKDRLQPGSRRPFLANRLVLISSMTKQRNLSSFKELDAYEGSLAMGNPQAVPAGVYARKTLTNLGLWSTFRDRVIPFPHVRGTLSAVESGNVDLGIVYRTDAKQSSNVTIIDEFPDESTPPIRYYIALTRTASNGGRQWFKELLASDRAPVYEHFGFRRISP